MTRPPGEEERWRARASDCRLAAEPEGRRTHSGIPRRPVWNDSRHACRSCRRCCSSVAMQQFRVDAVAGSTALRNRRLVVSPAVLSKPMRAHGPNRNARGMFEGMPRLCCKFFTFDDKHRRATNPYVWDSKDAAEGFFSEALRERVTYLYGVPPTIDFVEIAQISRQRELAEHWRAGQSAGSTRNTRPPVTNSC